MIYKPLIFLGSFLRLAIWLPLLSILISGNQTFNLRSSRKRYPRPQLLVPTGVQATAFYTTHPDRNHRNRVYH